MKRFLVAAMALVLTMTGAFAQRIRDIDIAVLIYKDGSADVLQDWDVNVVSGTEWYIPIENLGAVEISDLTVSENDKGFVREGYGWDSDRSAAAKAGRCGIIKKKNGVELCWGQGSMGDHKWTVTYHIDGLVQGFTDGYSGFNWQFVNPRMIAGPEHVSVKIFNYEATAEWSYDNTRTWGFGFEDADITIKDGAVVAETHSGMSRSNYINIMVRFDQGMFENLRVQRDMSFQDLRDIAQADADYGDETSSGKMDFWDWVVAIVFIGGILLLLFGFVFFLLFWLYTSVSGAKYSKAIFGEHKIHGWYREAPLEGNLNAAWYVLNKGARIMFTGNPGQLIGAYFLRWIMDGRVKVEKAKRNRINLVLETDPLEFSSDDTESRLYRMVYEASGDNHILENNEFSAWAKKHYAKAENWPKLAETAGGGYLTGTGRIVSGPKGTEKGKVDMKHVIEFKNFLTDFTLASEREAIEVKLWKDYLVYAQLFGVADKVAAQFKKLYPVEFEDFSRQNLSGVDIITFVAWNNTLSRGFASSASNASAASRSNSGRSGGFGGGFSGGGGGGFSGGGFGGGSR